MHSFSSPFNARFSFTYPIFSEWNAVRNKGKDITSCICPRGYQLIPRMGGERGKVNTAPSPFFTHPHPFPSTLLVGATITYRSWFAYTSVVARVEAIKNLVFCVDKLKKQGIHLCSFIKVRNKSKTKLLAKKNQMNLKNWLTCKVMTHWGLLKRIWIIKSDEVTSGKF